MTAYAPEDIVIVHGARTPVGTFLGGLSKLTPTALGVHAAKAAIARSAIDPAVVDAVYVGNVIQSAKDSAYLARHVALGAGVPVETPALTVNRLCGSGLEAIIQGARTLKLGEAKVVLAGGAENMSMTPFAMRGARKGWGLGRSQVDDMLWSALTDGEAGCQIGETVEHLAQTLKIGREAADEAAYASHARASAAQREGRLAAEIAPITIPGRRGSSVTIEHDEAIRHDASLEKMATLPPLYAKGGTCTPGNSAGLHDAAAMVVMTTWAVAKRRGLRPLGRLVSWGVAGVEPILMGLGPVPASRIALQKADLTIADMDLVEINDSFSAQYLAVAQKLTLDPERVNVNGGGVSIGHPMGATGTRIALSALLELERRSARYALTTVCIGGGQGIAAIFERPVAE